MARGVSSRDGREPDMTLRDASEGDEVRAVLKVGRVLGLY